VHGSMIRWSDTATQAPAAPPARTVLVTALDFVRAHTTTTGTDHPGDIFGLIRRQGRRDETQQGPSRGIDRPRSGPQRIACCKSVYSTVCTGATTESADPKAALTGAPPPPISAAHPVGSNTAISPAAIAAAFSVFLLFAFIETCLSSAGV
jgi:hypothetical protein